MANVTAPQFQQDVNNTADWANGDENTTVTMRLGQQADSPAKVIKRVDDLAAAQREDIYENATPYTIGNFTDGFTYTALNQRGEFGGDQYVFLGGLDGLPHVVAPATDPTVPPNDDLYKKANYNDAASVANANGGNVQNQIDIKDGLTVTEAINYAGIASLLGSRVWLRDRDAWFDVVLASTFSGDGEGMDELTSLANATYGLSLIKGKKSINIKHLGATMGVSDDSSYVYRALNILALGKGGKVEAPHSLTGYKLNIDIGSYNNPKKYTIDFNESYVYSADGVNPPISATQPSGYIKSSVRLKNLQIDGLTTVDNCVFISRSAIEFTNAFIRNSKLDGVYGEFAQYTVFKETSFLNCGTANDSFAVKCTNLGGAERSNELIFDDCSVLSNINGIACLGGEGWKFSKTQFIGQKTNTYAKRAALLLDKDAFGNGARVPIVDSGCWFELNNSRDIYIGICENPIIIGNFFSDANGGPNTPNKVNSVYSETAYNINHIGNYYLTADAPVFKATHTEPSVYSTGNSKKPDVSGITTKGEIRIDDDSQLPVDETNRSRIIKLLNSGAVFELQNDVGAALMTLAAASGNLSLLGRVKSNHVVVPSITEPSTTAGEFKLYIDSVDNTLKYKTDSGTVRTISFT